MRRLVLAALPVLALAACQTPREACLSEASHELRTVEALIRETQGNLNRGYAIETDQEVDVIHTTCEVERPVAIDLVAERAQLDSLLEQRGRLLGQAQARQQACVVTYPE